MRQNNEGNSDSINSPREGELIGIRIMPDETLVAVENFMPNRSNVAYSAMRAIQMLTGAHKFKDVGYYGPSNASRGYDNDEENKEANQGLFDVFFPRDAHVVAEILFNQIPQLTHATILAALEGIGTTDNYKNPKKPFDEQEVGKIPHEFRVSEDPIAMKLTEEKDWGWPYYGAVDTTGKNVIAIARYAAHPDEGLAFLEEKFSDQSGAERTVKEGLDMNIAWLLGRLDLNPEGLLESLAKNPKHHANQTWADSPEAFHHADGSWAEHYPEKNVGVAGLELQGETFRALKEAAQLYEDLGETEKAAELRKRADNIRRVVLEKFWVDDPEHFGGYFGRGTDRDADGNLRPLAIRTSDMGLLLNSGLLDDTGDEVLDQEIRYKREAVVQNLLSEEMLGLNGIRTLSSDSMRYSPDRYHNGTTWPWVTYLTAEGLRRYGYEAEADDLDDRIMAACEATGILGEYFSGSNDPEHRMVTQRVIVENATLTTEPIYAVCQPAQEVQAWTVAAVLAIKLRRGRRILVASPA